MQLYSQKWSKAMTKADKNDKTRLELLRAALAILTVAGTEGKGWHVLTAPSLTDQSTHSHHDHLACMCLAYMCLACMCLAYMCLAYMCHHRPLTSAKFFSGVKSCLETALACSTNRANSTSPSYRPVGQHSQPPASHQPATSHQPPASQPPVSRCRGAHLLLQLSPLRFALRQLARVRKVF